MNVRSFLGSLSLILACAHTVSAQVTEPDNNITVNTSYVGCDGASLFPLKVMHNANLPIEWYTDSIQRMWLTPTLTGLTVNGYTGLDLSGRLGIGDFNSPVNQPLALLHLDSAGTEVAGYRPWMGTGVLMTKTSDMMYVGMMGGDDDRSDAIISWSDNVEDQPDYGPDRLRFIFTNEPPATPTMTAQELHGLELARIIPDQNGDEGYFGIGDWHTAGVEPDERLDILNGKVRIRALPSDSTSLSTEMVTVNMANGILEHRPITALPDNCEWSLGGGANNNNVWTAMGTSNACPNDNNTVGIGTTSSGAKLNVVRKPTSGDEGGLAVSTTTDGNYGGPASIAYGISGSISNVTSQGRAPYHYGLRGVAFHASLENVGVYGQVSNDILNPGTRNKGVSGIAQGTNTTYGVHGKGWGQNINHGVYGEAVTTGTVNYGVYGTVSGAGAGIKYAGYFQGKVMITDSAWVHGNVLVTSDANLKTDISDIDDPLGLVMQLNPKTYSFSPDALPQISLPEGPQIGLLAQEVQEVIPVAVGKTIVPASYDTTGVELFPEMSIQGINYNAIIPVLIGAIKQQNLQWVDQQEVVQHQQSQIEEQEATIAEQASTNQATTDQLVEVLDRIDQLEQLLALCCQNPIGPDQRDMIDEGNGINDPADDRNLRIQPNPFNEQTTVYYNLERSGRMQLMANSSDGKQLRVLQEAQMEAGQYQYEWHTADLSAGVYYVTLLLDGEPIVKKAVKVN